MGDIKKAVKILKQICKDDTHGYSQINRNGNPDFDCSSLISYCLNEAGFNVKKGSTTRNIREQLIKDGFEIIEKGPWKAGDIHLTEGKHIVMSINAKEIGHASIDEKGTIKGATKGDQTGKEICIRSYYDKPWQYHLRYKENNKKEEEKTKILTVLVNGLNTRKGPGINYEVVKCNKLNRYNKIKIYGDIIKVNGNEWAKVANGYVCVKFNGKQYAK